MLFNSYIFLFCFLPFTLLIYHLLGKRPWPKASLAWLVFTSLFFYSWWNPRYLTLILISILFNYGLGSMLSKTPKKNLLILGIIFNLAILGYYKYANFFIDNLNVILHSNIHLPSIILPLAISFFTFQQLAYLVDSYRGLTQEYDFLRYCLFVTFFPQLIAGPIVHHKDIIPQFNQLNKYQLKPENFNIGFTFFFIGLFKKVVFADTASLYVSPIFDAANHGLALTFIEAWIGVIAYTLQIYFDFSGYSDMAIGLARLFSITLPINFFSPYKAKNIIDFWRRWHITLSNFLRDYLYIPLGGNRKGKARRYMNLLTTMILGGLWHGASWNFVMWGALHGFYLSLNHTWHRIWQKTSRAPSIMRTFISRLITFCSVAFAWVLFRSDTLFAAKNLYKSMIGVHGISLPPSLKLHLGFLSHIGFNFTGAFPNGALDFPKHILANLFVFLSIALFAPNTVEWLRNEKPALYYEQFLSSKNSKFVWKTHWIYLVSSVLIAVIATMLIQKESEFLYFRF